MKDNKPEQSENSVADFIESIPNETRKKDGFFVTEMMERIANSPTERRGPTIIGCGSYTHHYESGHEKNLPLLAFSPRKQHLVFYVLNNFEKQQQLLDKLGKHKRGNICLYINKLADVNLEILERIMTASYNKNKLRNVTDEQN